MKTKLLMMTSLLLILFSMSFANALQPSFSGRIVFIDPKLRVFIVQGKTEEQTFHPSAASQFMINGERKLFGELRKGEDVTVVVER